MRLLDATADDLDALTSRWYALAREMEQYDDLNELSDDALGDVPDDGFRALLDDEAVSNYLIAHDGETIGFLTLREGDHPSREQARYLRIENLAIDEEHRGQGHGTAVIERVRAIARERDCDQLKVSCEWHNDGARRFYRRVGLRPKQVQFAQPIAGSD
ncbi:GNAT family N-acetyltransferase [Halosegnis longus]|uniref:GNAT family N-acetyltransferase n=1 Tax=Halosegnis longus TaxID=2216012 RepID=A0AAJ4UVG2_9EURY|nr:MULTISPECIES: GNAT family N-acetyltransferase [Halobacteriales]RNJ25925.1 GNAT family N-acetyltransferase [Salella cibi]